MSKKTLVKKRANKKSVNALVHLYGSAETGKANNCTCDNCACDKCK